MKGFKKSTLAWNISRIMLASIFLYIAIICLRVSIIERHDQMVVQAFNESFLSGLGILFLATFFVPLVVCASATWCLLMCRPLVVRITAMVSGLFFLAFMYISRALGAPVPWILLLFVIVLIMGIYVNKPEA